MHKVRVNHRVSTSMFFYLDNLLNAPIEIQINRIGDDIVKAFKEKGFIAKVELIL